MSQSVLTLVGAITIAVALWGFFCAAELLQARAASKAITTTEMTIHSVFMASYWFTSQLAPSFFLPIFALNTSALKPLFIQFEGYPPWTCMSLWISWGETTLSQTGSNLEGIVQKTLRLFKVSTATLYQPVGNMCVHFATYCSIRHTACWLLFRQHFSATF